MTNISLGSVSTVNSYIQTNTKRKVAYNVADNYVDRRTDDFENLLKSTSTSGCSCCGSSDDIESTFDVRI